MNVDDVYGGGYLKSEHLNGQDVPVKIEAVAEETVGQGADAKRQIVLNFIGKDKRFGLNQTNAGTIAGMYGKDCGDWIGRALVLYVDPNVMMSGKRVGGIRIRPSLPAPVMAAAAVETVAADDGDSTTPF